MGIIESIKKGFGVASGSMGLVLALFVFGFIWNLINVFAFKNSENPSTSQAIVMIVTAVAFILFTIFMQAGSLGYVRDRVKSGTATLSSFASSGGKYYWRVLLIGLIVGAVAAVFILLASLALALLGKGPQQAAAVAGEAAATGNPVLSALAIALAATLVIAGVYFILLMFLAPYIAIIEERKAIESIKKSVSTVKANFLRILGLFGLLILIGFVFGLAVGLLFALVNLATKGGTVSDVIFAALSSLVNSYLGLVVTGAFMSFYLGLSSQSNNTVGA